LVQASSYRPRQAQVAPTWYRLIYALSGGLLCAQGDCQDNPPVPLVHAPMMAPGDERSKRKGYWAATIGARMGEWWRLAFTDDTDLGGANGSGGLLRGSQGQAG